MKQELVHALHAATTTAVLTITTYEAFSLLQPRDAELASIPTPQLRSYATSTSSSYYQKVTRITSIYNPDIR